MTQATGIGAVPSWTFADRLRKAREFAGLSQTELADEIEVSRNTISNYEAERSTPQRIVVRQWAMRCGVSLDWLWDGTAPTSPDDGEQSRLSDSNRRPTAYKAVALTN